MDHIISNPYTDEQPDHCERNPACDAQMIGMALIGSGWGIGVTHYVVIPLNIEKLGQLLLSINRVSNAYGLTSKGICLTEPCVAKVFTWAPHARTHERSVIQAIRDMALTPPCGTTYINRKASDVSTLSYPIYYLLKPQRGGIW